MRIAVASQNLQTITPHAGKTRMFIVFDAQPGRAPEQLGRLQLPPGQTIHDWPADAPHPLEAVDVVIAGSAGSKFVANLARRGVRTVITDATDPLTAAALCADDQLPSLPPHEH